MKTFLRLLVVLMSLHAALPVIAGDEKAALEKPAKSPSGKITIEYRFNENADDDHFNEIWLVASDNERDRHLLFSHGRSAEVLFAPNEQWLAINDYCFSNRSEVRLFKRLCGLEFVEVMSTCNRGQTTVLVIARMFLSPPVQSGSRVGRAKTQCCPTFHNSRRAQVPDLPGYLAQTSDESGAGPKSVPGRYRAVGAITVA